MSAFMVSRHHVDMLVLASIRVLERDLNDADSIGQMLWTENHRSVCARYKAEDQPPVYKYTPGKLLLLDVSLLKQISCYMYQSCEHPEWRDSEACKLCEQLRGVIISRLPGYEEAPWGV